MALLWGASPWAESPALVEKATDPSFSAVVSMPYVLHRDLWDPFPRTDDADAPLFGQWSWMGRRSTSLDPELSDSSLRIGFGNEVGDKLFRETGAADKENRTPGMWAYGTTPRASGWRAGVYFDQVDHFSDRMLGVREALLGNPSVEDRGHAYFGDNIPDQSFVGGGVDGIRPFPVSGSVRSGWIWLSSPGVGQLQCWRATTAQASVHWGRLEWSHAQGWFDRADTSRGSLGQSQGWLQVAVLDEPSLSAEAGVSYRGQWRTRDVSWRPESDASLEPWVRIGAKAGNWSLRGFHQIGTDFFLVRDTLRWNRRLGEWNATFGLSAQWSDRPDGSAPFLDSSSVGVARMDCRALEQGYQASAGFDRRFADVTVEGRASPWWVVHARAFSPESFDTIEEKWIVRSGREVALPGVLWGCKARASVQWRASDFLSLDAAAQLDPVLGGPRSRTDLVAPSWGTSLGAKFTHRSGISVRPVLLWRASSTLRHRSPEDWTVPSAPDLNLWIDQEYFGGRVALSCAALNILSDDAIEAPNAAEDRFRILVQVGARLF
jgi:hypothetical protein